MLDIIFISYDEPNADRNFERLKARFPHARRVHGVKGIANAHIAASKKAMTKFFFVVDGDAVIKDDFNFDFQPVGTEVDFVHIWMAENPIGLTYGYGGVKLFNKAFFKDVKNQLDFSTTLTKDVKYHEQVSCITEFNSDKYRAFRGAFREAAKLAYYLNAPTSVRQDLLTEAAERLEVWMDPPPIAYREFVVEGAKAGVEFAVNDDDLSFINEHELIESELKYRFEEDDEPPPGVGDQFFFLTRLASILYDPTVVSTLPITELRDAMSDGQIYSKKWLVDELRLFIKRPQHIAILGGWIGTLALMMQTLNVFAKITSVDTDRRANRIAEKLNYDNDEFKTITEDMYKLDYSDFDVIINTSSEHIPDISAWRASIPAGKILAVQNNNFTEGGGHISCVQSAEELKTKLNLQEILYVGTRKFPQYDRYMVIGRT